MKRDSVESGERVKVKIFHILEMFRGACDFASSFCFDFIAGLLGDL